MGLGCIPQLQGCSHWRIHLKHLLRIPASHAHQWVLRSIVSCFALIPIAVIIPRDTALSKHCSLLGCPFQHRAAWPAALLSPAAVLGACVWAHTPQPCWCSTACHCYHCAQLVTHHRVPAGQQHQAPRSSPAQTVVERWFSGGGPGRLDTLTTLGCLTARFWTGE